MKAIFNYLLNVIAKSSAILAVVMLSMNFIPDSMFNEFDLDPKTADMVDYDSVVPQWNNKLSEGSPQFIQLNEINGPESIAISPKGLLYTGLADGRLIELDPSRNYQMRKVLRIKEDTAQVKCKDNVATQPECGRILQLRFVNGTLYGIEASSGLYMFDTKTGSKILLGPKPISKVIIYNSFVFDPKDSNIVYMTISSTRWQLVNFMWSIFERETTAKILAFNIKSGKRVVIADNLMMANGIDVDIARDRLIFAETMLSKVSFIKLKDVRPAFQAANDGEIARVQISPLIEIAPGFPDNIIIEKDLAYIALPFVHKNGRELVDFMASMPKLRKAIGRATWLAGVLVESIENLYPHPLLKDLMRQLKTGHIHYRLFQTDSSAVIEYNLDTGASRFFGSDTFGFVSEAMPDNQGNLYLGSFRSPFFVKQKLPK